MNSSAVSYIVIAVLLLALVGYIGYEQMSSSSAEAALSTEAPAFDEPVLLASVSPPAPKVEPVTLSLNFAEANSHELEFCKVDVNGKSIKVSDCCGNLLGSFKVDGNGKLSASGTQPSGSIVKSAYSGPPGDTYSSYKIYSKNEYNTSQYTPPKLLVEYDAGSMTITPGSLIEKKVQDDGRRARGKSSNRSIAGGCGGGTSSGGGG
jgi:hypothetical protein